MVLGEGRALMGVKRVVGYELTCDVCEYRAEEDEGELMIFDDEDAAMRYGEDGGWHVLRSGDPIIQCPECSGGKA